jgi:GTP-binding protein
MQIKDVTFLGGSDVIAQLPPSRALAEIALVGRSNVGKSSLINRVCSRKQLARVSKTPGRTQQINLFFVQLAPKGRKQFDITLADLPGFGFAKLSHEKKAVIHDCILSYIEERTSLSVVCLLNDIRRDPGEEEQTVMQLCADSNRVLVVVLTKCDKISRNELAQRVKLITAAYHITPQDVILSGEDHDPSAFWDFMLRIVKS